MRIRWSLIPLLMLACCAASNVKAQDYHMAVPNYADAYTIPRQNVSRNLRYWESERSLSARLRTRRARTTSNTKGTPSNPNGGTTSTASAGDGSTTFQPVAQRVLPALLAQDKATSPGERKEIEQFFDKLLDTYKDAVRQKGATQNDVARAASFLLFNSYYIYRDGRELTAQQMDAAREQLHDAFATDTQFQRRSNRDKQEIFESYAITGIYLGAIYEGAKRAGDHAKVAEMQALARQQIEETLGAPINQIAFTDNGIEYR
jgi:hypothetical protein